MHDILELISNLGIADCWRFCLCLIVAGVAYWFLTASPPAASHTSLAVCLFGAAGIFGIFWEYSAYQGRRRR